MKNTNTTATTATPETRARLDEAVARAMEEIATLTGAVEYLADCRRQTAMELYEFQKAWQAHHGRLDNPPWLTMARLDPEIATLLADAGCVAPLLVVLPGKRPDGARPDWQRRPDADSAKRFTKRWADWLKHEKVAATKV